MTDSTFRLRDKKRRLFLQPAILAIVYVTVFASDLSLCALAKAAPAKAIAVSMPPKSKSTSQARSFKLLLARQALKTTVHAGRDDVPAPEPPAGIFDKVSYTAPLGQNVAYVTPVQSGARRPAIIWIAGGFNFGLDDNFWREQPRDNDQSAAVFRKAGIVEMLPALRGASRNPGEHECFLGEVDDILAASEFLAKRPDVDADRIYLGGHSTGGTMVLLAAESTARFRAVFAFGAIPDARGYGRSGCLQNGLPESEWKPRAPLEYFGEITSPTFLIEGMRDGNGGAFPYFRKKVGKAPVHFVEVKEGTHFTVLAPGSEVVAKAILADKGKKATISITAKQIKSAMAKTKSI